MNQDERMEPAKPRVKVMDPEVAVIPELADIAGEVALTTHVQDGLADALAKLENSAAIFQKRLELQELCFRAAIKRTHPQDWTLTKWKDGSVTARLMESGCNVVGQAFGIEVHGIRPLDKNGNPAPQRSANPNGSYTLRLWCDARSKVTGLDVEGIMAARRSDEDFTGRSVDGDGNMTTNPSKRAGALDSDLEVAVLTLCRTKPIRILSGTTKVPASVLDDCWAGTKKTSAACPKGHGFGSSTDRNAAGVTEPDVVKGAAELWATILQRTGGDADAARDVLREVTSFTPKGGGKPFAGYDSVARITTDKMLNLARRTLATHPVFGEKDGD